MLRRLLLLVFLSQLAAADPCRQLLEAIDQRLELSRQVAAYKWTHHLPIEDSAREQALLDSIPDERARDFIRCQIEASKQLQGELFELYESQPPAAPPQDLTRIRLQIDRLTRQITDNLSHLPCPNWRSQAQALWGVEPPPWVDTAIEPLSK